MEIPEGIGFLILRIVTNYFFFCVFNHKLMELLA